VKFLLFVLLIHFGNFLFTSHIFIKQDSLNASQKALQIVQNNLQFIDSTEQLVVVFNNSPEESKAILVAVEKVHNNWKVVKAPVKVGIGRSGFAAPGEKREGDKKSPTGIFRLGQLFCYENAVQTKMPYIQTNNDDKWIDDPESPDYNKYIRGTTSALSWENLELKGNDYYYCMVIEYNFRPVIKGMGSAIFMHLSEGDELNESAGCVIVLQKDMEWLLNWMLPTSNPSIIMGTEKILLKGASN